MVCRTKHGYYKSNVLSLEGIVDNVPRIFCKVGNIKCSSLKLQTVFQLKLTLVNLVVSDQDISPEDFVKQYEEPRIPAVITGLTDGWRGKWTIEDLLTRFGNHKFKVSYTLHKYCLCHQPDYQDIPTSCLGEITFGLMVEDAYCCNCFSCQMHFLCNTSMLIETENVDIAAYMQKQLHLFGQFFGILQASEFWKHMLSGGK